MPIVHDPKTGKFSSSGGASSARGASKAFIKPGAKDRENRLGAKTLEVLGRNGTTVTAAEKYTGGGYGSKQTIHVTKLVKA